MEQGTSRVKRLEKLRQMLEPFLFLFWCVAFDTRWQHVTCYFDVLLNVNMRYIWFYAVVNGLNILVCFLVWNGNSNKRAENWAKIDLRMLLWAEKMAQVLKWAVNAMSSCTSAATLAPLSTSLTCQQPCYWPCHHCYPRHWQVNSHVILHVINVWHGNWICDKNYTICDIYFRHRKWVWVGLWRLGDILWRFQNVMDEAIYNEILKNVTRCDLWRSIHDAIWDHHRYCFMMVF